MFEPVQNIRYFWEVTLPDGQVFSQFDESGKFVKWDLKWQPVRVVLRPFTAEFADLVRQASGRAALATDSKPIIVEGDGIKWARQDQRTATTLLITCLKCNHKFPFFPDIENVCPKCGAKDEWVCSICRTPKTPLIRDDHALCPDCAALGRTWGLKRIRAFKPTPILSYETHYAVDIQPTEMMELRITDDEIILRPKARPQA